MSMKGRSLSKVGYAGWTAGADAGSVTSYPTFARRQTFITLLIRMRLMFIVRRTKVIINIKFFKNGEGQNSGLSFMCINLDVTLIPPGHGGYHLVLSQLISHVTPYELECSHWWKICSPV